MSTAPAELIARALKLPARGVAAALELLEGGDTLPFVARYRKERTGGLDEAELAAIEEARLRHKRLEERRQTILATLEERGALSPQLRAALEGATELQRLEDIYEPHKQKRKTRAELARQAGLGDLASWISGGERGRLRELAERAIAAGATAEGPEAALAGAADILAEQVADDPDRRARAREDCWRRGRIAVKYRRGGADKDERGTYRDLDGYGRKLADLPADRVLATLRGEREKILSAKIEMDDARHRQGLLAALTREAHDDRERRDWFAAVADDAWERLLWPRVQVDVRRALREQAEQASIEVFASNTEALLLRPPLGPRPLLAIDPGLRTGCKIAALDASGVVLETATIYPTAPRRDTDGSERVVRRLCAAHGIETAAVGRGTGGRETARWLRSLRDPAIEVHLVDEAGASVYSASPLAREELPDLDLTFRGAASIGRRLQDPLAELVKIDPRSIGVGQYQHDVDQTDLARCLERVVQLVVNRVGVRLETASPHLLAQVAGLGPTLARRIVAARGAQGGFRRLRDLLDVDGLGPRTFEQAAGFLRLAGEEPLDDTGVHPEAYAKVGEMAASLGCQPAELVGDRQRLRGLRAEDFCDERFGLPTLQHALAELAAPGADIRGELEEVTYADVSELTDLHVGMSLPGVVTNVTRFGAFVDLGIKKDGLIHISQLADRYVRDPHEIVAPGDTVTVEVLEIDTQRQRVALKRLG